MFAVSWLDVKLGKKMQTCESFEKAEELVDELYDNGHVVEDPDAQIEIVIG